MSEVEEGLLAEAGGVWRLTRAVTQWAWSPDDAWLAVALAELDGAGRSVLCVIEVDAGRIAMRVPGRTIEGIGWASPEHLVVTRAQDLGTRAILHAVPDGTVLGSVALPSLHGGRQRVSAGASHGGVADALLVTPWRWHGGAAQRVRHRAGYVLRVEPFEVAREVLPTAWRALPTLPHARPMVAALEPDGTHVLFWLGEPDATGVVGASPGALVRYAWQEDRATLVGRAGARVVELLCCDPTRVVLREAAGDDISARGEIAVVDAQSGDVLARTDGGLDDVGPWATMDLHPDRERVLVAGRVAKARRWVGALREASVALAGTGVAVEVTTAAQRAMGAVWQGEGDALWVLASRGADGAQIRGWPSLRAGEGTATAGWALPLEGKSPSQAHLAWSPMRTRLTVGWRCVPERADAAQRALGVSRVAWVSLTRG